MKKKQWVQVGTLSKSLNEIYLPFDMTYELKIVWEANNIPTISEIVRLNDDEFLPELEALQKYVNSLNVDENNYTASSYAKYVSKLNQANEVLSTASGDKKLIIKAYSELQIAYTNLVTRGNAQLIKDELNKIDALVADDYTDSTWEALQDKVNEANTLLAKGEEELNVKEVADMVNILQVAKSNLITKVSVSKEVLQNYIDTNELDNLDTSKYLTSTATPFVDALKVAHDLIASDDATVKQLEDALTALQETRAALVLKATADEINAINGLIDSYKENNYTASTWKEFVKVLTEVKDALNDEKNISEEDAQTLETAIKDAKEHLVYSTMQSELAENTLANDEGKFIEANYSVVTYQAYQKAKEDMTNDIQNSADPVNMAKAKTAYKESVNQLADITELQNLHHDFNNMNKDLYEATTYQAYEKAVNETKELFNTGTIDTVKKEIDRLQEAKAGLLFKGNVMMIDMIKELEKISPADYTKASFEVLSNEIELAKADVNNSNADIIQAHIQKLKEAQKQLVDIRNYLHAVETTTAYQKADYTKDSFNALQKVLHDTAIVKQKATAAEVDKACQDIQNALKALDPLAKDLESYRTALTKEKADVYTDSTYQLYAQAYQKLMALDAENTNIITFLNAKRCL